MIRDWYLEQLMADKENQVVYQELMAANPSLNQTLTLFCREAKEKVYSFKTERPIFSLGISARCSYPGKSWIICSAPFRSRIF